MPKPASGDVEQRRRDGARPAAAPAARARTPQPKVFYLFYADGQDDLPATDYNACERRTPPKFKCTFAPTLAECQRQVQAYLDKWYADFNIVFTLTRPTSGKFYTEVVSSGGGAGATSRRRWRASRRSSATTSHGGVAYTFLGGQSAKQTAVIIAQEQAHLVGLEHVTSTDRHHVPAASASDCDGFENKELPIDGDRCDRDTQNSYQMLKAALGACGRAGPSRRRSAASTTARRPG